MKSEIKQLEKQLPKKHKFGFTPQYAENFRTQLSEKAFFYIVHQVVEKLDWDIIYVDEHFIEAKRKVKSLGITQYTESISVRYDFGNVHVKSESLGNEIWDNGRNSKRVKLFINVFQSIEREQNSETLAEFEKEQAAKDNWEDYQIPTTLPTPNSIRVPNAVFPLVSSVLAALVLAFILAKVALATGNYVLFLFDFILGLALAFSLKFGIKRGNFTDIAKLKNMLIVAVLLVFIGSQFFHYTIIAPYQIGFIEFMKSKINYGLTIKSFNAGSLGLIISWIVQLGLTFAFGYLYLTRFLINYVINRVPTEVTDFAFYHFVKGKTEEQVRSELASLGWNEQQNQDEVFEAIEAIGLSNEMNRTT